MSPTQLVVFDIDDTLTRTMGVDTECFVRTIREVMEVEPTGSTEVAEEAARLAEALQQLSHQERDVLLMVGVAGLDGATAARALGRSGCGMSASRRESRPRCSPARAPSSGESW